MNKGKVWNTKLIEQVNKLLNEGKNTYEISQIIGLTRKQITNKLGKLGINVDRSKSHIHLHVKYNCLNCNKEFTDLKTHNERKFCSHSCSASYINLTKSELKKCLNCNSHFRSNSKQYCSKKCADKFRTKKINELIENGDMNQTHFSYRRYLILKHGEKCMKCGWNEKNPYSGKIPIELEHKDGNSENNSLDNLELLCPNCHSLTKTYKALNIGNGRHIRRERYKEGKSF